MKDPKVGLWACSASIVAPNDNEKGNIRWHAKYSYERVRFGWEYLELALA
jgi:hypothetical protein